LRRSLLAYSAVGFGLFASAALAQSREEYIEQCLHDEFDYAIDGCTVLIESGLESERNLSVSYFHRGLAYHRTQEHDRAIEDFDEAIKLRPGFLNAYFQRGDAHFANGNYDRAIEDFTEVVMLDPTDSIAFRYRGDVHLAKGDADSAVRDYNEALRLDPEDGAALEARERALTGG
jgi:tetratricopeptide (TPR) repeat protein